MQSEVPVAQPVAASRHLRAIGLMAVLGAALELLRFRDPTYAVDDAWISFRIARNWLQAGVPTFDLGRPPVEGMTNLLWTVMSASWIKVLPDSDPIVLARVLGGLLLLATVFVLVTTAIRMAGRLNGNAVLGGTVTGMCIATSGWLAFHALSGLETALYGLLFALTLDQWDRLSETWSCSAGWGVGVSLALLGATRPEGVLIAILFVAVCLYRFGAGPTLWRVATPCVLLLGLVELFRWHTYGALVPNTFEAKPPNLNAGLLYFIEAVIFGIGVVPLLPCIAALTRRSSRDIALVIVITAAATVISGGDWMPGFRRQIPFVLGVAVLCGAGLGGLRRLAIPSAVLCVLAWIVGNAALGLSGKDSVHSDTQDLAALGQRVAATPSIHSVALSDIGAFGWYYHGSILDLYGLTDRYLASLNSSDNRDPLALAYVSSSAPDLVLLRSRTRVSDPLPASLSVASNERSLLLWLLRDPRYNYRGYIPMRYGFTLLAFVRQGVTLPERLWGPLPTKSLQQLIREHGETEGRSLPTR